MSMIFCLTKVVKGNLFAFFLIVVLMMNANTAAQTNSLSLKFNDVYLIDALKKIEIETRYTFAYNSNILPSNYKVNISFEKKTIQYVLSNLLKGTGIEYRLLDHQVILKKKIQLNEFKLSGYIQGKDDRQNLGNVYVIDKGSFKGVYSNNDGYYTLSLTEGIHCIVYSYVGMKEISKNIALYEDTKLDIALEPELEIEEVTVNGRAVSELINKESSLGKMQMVSKDIEVLPVVMGEPDVVKALQMLPGVQSGMESNGALYVRGGDPIQNLFMLDDIPIYNAYHLMGLFSVFNSDVIKSTEIYKSSYPSKYSGRLSSVLDIRSKDGNYEKIHGKVSLGMVSSRLSIEGPIVKDKTSFLLAGRLGYYNLYGEFLPKLISGSSGGVNKYNFQDFNMKIVHKFNNGNKLYVSGYYGKDVGQELDSETVLKRNEIEEVIGTTKYEFCDGENWYNILGVIGWSGKISNKLFGNFHLATSIYNYQNEHNISSHSESDIENTWEYINELMENGIKNYGGSLSFKYDFSSKVNCEFGYKYANIDYKSNRYVENDFKDLVNSIKDTQERESIEFINKQTTEQNLYLEVNYNVSDKLNMVGGFNLSNYETVGYVKRFLQPRVKFNYELNSDIILKASFSKMQQNLHLLGIAKIKLASDMIAPASYNVPSETSNQFSLGLSFLKFPKLKIHLDSYIKEMSNLINFKEGTSYYNEPLNWENNIILGIGRSKGIELLLEKPYGDLSGWIGYSLAKVDRKFSGINNGDFFPFRYEHRHHINLVTKYKFSEKWSLNATWLYHTGNKETIPDKFYWDYGPIFSSKIESHQVRVLNNKKNAYENPDYHRLDMSLQYERKGKIGTSTWNLSIFNLYNRLNVYSSSFYVEPADPNQQKFFKERKLKYKSYFGIIPSLNYTLKF